MAISWKKLSTTRQAAMACSCHAALECIELNPEIMKDGSEEEEDELKENEKGALIWDTLVKSGIQSMAARSIGECFEIVIGCKVVPAEMSTSASSNFWKDAFSGYSHMPVVPMSNPNSHNYKLKRVCVLDRYGENGGALRMTGTIGNNLPETNIARFALPSIESLALFFSVKRGPTLREIKTFFGDEYHEIIDDEVAETIIDKYALAVDAIKKAGTLLVL